MEYRDMRVGMEVRIVPMTRVQFKDAVRGGMHNVGYIPDMGRTGVTNVILQLNGRAARMGGGGWYAPQQLEPLVQEYEVL